MRKGDLKYFLIRINDEPTKMIFLHEYQIRGTTFKEGDGFEFPAKISFANNSKTMPTYLWFYFSCLKDTQNVSVELIFFEIRPKRYFQSGINCFLIFYRQ